MTKYETVAQDLQQKIMSGEYQANDQLPTLSELCDIYAVSKITVKKAMELLQAQGLVATRRGSGSYVKGIAQHELSVPAYETSLQMGGFSSDHAARGENVRTEVEDFSVVNPPADVAEKLGMERDEFAYHVCRVRYANETPQVVEYTYMPIKVVPDLRAEHVAGSIYGYIEGDLGLRIDSAHRAVRAVMPTKQERAWLDLKSKPNVPLLEVEQVGFLDDGRAFEYSVVRHAGDLYVLHTVSSHRQTR